MSARGRSAFFVLAFLAVSSAASAEAQEKLLVAAQPQKSGQGKKPRRKRLHHRYLWIAPRVRSFLPRDAVFVHGYEISYPAHKLYVNKAVAF
jgi:hypothetical protein